MELILQWIDLVWLAVAWVVATKPQRFLAVAAIFACMAMMRLMVEFMESLGYPRGIIGVIQSPVFIRGLMVYSFFYLFYMLFVHFSQRSGALLLAASLTIFFGAALTFSLFMVL